MEKLANQSPLYLFPYTERINVLVFFNLMLQHNDLYCRSTFRAKVNEKRTTFLIELRYIPTTDQLFATVSESRQSMDVYRIEHYQATHNRLISTQIRSFSMVENRLNPQSQRVMIDRYTYIGSYDYEELDTILICLF